MKAVILSRPEDATRLSDFWLEHSDRASTTTPALVFQDATAKSGLSTSVAISAEQQTLKFSIHTPSTGQTRISDGPFGKVKSESPGVWLLCFEDEADSDFNDVVVRVWDESCDHEERSVELGPDPIKVAYDPKFAWNPLDKHYLKKAEWLAQGIRDRAAIARGEFAALYDSFGSRAEVDGYNVLFNVRCALVWGTGLISRQMEGEAFVESRNIVNIHGPRFQGLMARYVNDRLIQELGFPVELSIAGHAWADIVDHELYHTYEAAGLNEFVHFLRIVEGDHVNLESLAQMSQDLLLDTDDLVPAEGNNHSYRTFTNASLIDPETSPFVMDERTSESYRWGGLFQYLGEQYGEGPTLEKRVAEFGRDVYLSAKRLDGIAAAMGGTREDVLDEVRDFFVTAAIRDASNRDEWPDHFRLFDESTMYGQTPNPGPPLQNLRYGSLDPRIADLEFDTLEDGELAPTTATIWKFESVPFGTELLEVTISDRSGPSFQQVGRSVTPVKHDPLRIALLAALSNGNILHEPAYLTAGPKRNGTNTYTVTGTGISSFSLLMVGGETRSEFDVRVRPVQGDLGLTIGGVEVRGNLMIVRATPTVGGVYAKSQPASGFAARVDGAPWPISASVYGGSETVIIVPGASSLAPGQHALELTFRIGGREVVETQTFDVPDSLSLMSSNVDIPVVALTGSGLAGDPIELGAVVTDDGEPIIGASVTATVIDPQGMSRATMLTDHGAYNDSADSDGAYGNEAFGTSLQGQYQVTFDATGSTNGSPFSVSRTEFVTLAEGTDTDLDAVSDSMEVRLGLDPGDPSDGSSDLDLDGVGTAAELARGSDPTSPDSDGAGEADGSEIAGGSDPLDPADDAVLPVLVAAATAVDGRRVQIELDVAPNTGAAHLYRVTETSVTDLGVLTADQVVTDGPLPAGTYAYHVAPEAASGRQGPVEGLGPIEVRDDATAPTAAFEITSGAAVTRQRNVAVGFNSVAGSPVQVRLAHSESALFEASWVPYQSPSTFELPDVDGSHPIWAQLRDGAGNQSIAYSRDVTLDRNTPSSTVGPLPSYSLSSWVNLPFVASDDHAVAQIEVWLRFRAAPSGGWGPWTFNVRSASSPVPTVLGDGYYEFASVAVDVAGNRESLPATADAAMRIGPEIVNDDVGTAFQGFAQATTGLDGTVAVTWVDNRNSASVADIYFARRQDATSTWGTNERVDNAAVSASSPAVAIDAIGNAYVAWVDTRRGDKDIYVAKRSATTGAWGPGVLINDDPAGAVQDTPSIAIAPSGEVIVVWADYRSNKQHIYSARLPAGSSTWSADIRVTSDQAKPKSAPSLAIGSTGIAYVVWQQTNQRVGVWFSTLPSGGTTWSSATQINDPSREQRAPRIGVDSSGRLTAIYLEFSNTIWSRTRPAGSSTWSAPVTIGNPPASAFGPTLAVRGDGHAYAGWTTQSGVLWSSRFDPTTATWAVGVQLSVSGVHSRPAIAMTPTYAIVAAELGSGTQANLRAYRASVP